MNSIPWNKSRVAQKLAISYPILQGPFGGGYSTAKLVAEVSNSGGLGGYGAYTLSTSELEKEIQQIRLLTTQPFNINLWVNNMDEYSQQELHFRYVQAIEAFRPFFEELKLDIPNVPSIESVSFELQVETALRLGVPVLSFVFGIPDKAILTACKEQGIITIGAATTLDEAVMLEDAGLDLIVASGSEAGGHRPSFLRPAEDSLTGTFVLIQQISKNIRTPIIAAGGIADSRGIKAAMALGAEGVQIGTAFLGCEESGATDLLRSRLFSDAARHTVLTRSLTGRLGRGSKGKISDEISSSQVILPFPLQSRWLQILRTTAIEQKKENWLTYWMGQIATNVVPKKASMLMKELVHGME